MLPKFTKGWLGGLKKLDVSCGFGFRQHPVTNKWGSHYGIDIKVPSETPIYAPIQCFYGDTKVQRDNQNNVTGFGKYCWVTYEDENYVYQIIFAHLTSKKYLPYLKNQKFDVNDGKIITYTGGNTDDPQAGTSTGAHLHLEIRKIKSEDFSIYSQGGGLLPQSFAINPIQYISDTLLIDKRSC